MNVLVFYERYWCFESSFVTLAIENIELVDQIIS